MAGLNWLKVDASIFEHPKTRRLARALGISPEQTVGHLIRLWSWALRISPDGLLKNADAIDIAEAANYPGDADAFLEALLSCSSAGVGFMEKTEEGYLAFHDWNEYSGALEQKREKDRERKRNKTEIPKNSTDSQDIPRKSTEIHGNPENSTEFQNVPRNSSLREEKTREEKNREEDKKHSSDSEENQGILQAEFERLWNAYPRKEGKTQALKSYISHRQSGVSHEEIAAGLKNYLARLKAECTEARYIKAGSTFFGPAAAWKDFLTAAPPGGYGGMIEPQTPRQFEDEKEFIAQNFGGDTHAYAQWLSAGSPQPIREWYARHRARTDGHQRDRAEVS